MAKIKYYAVCPVYCCGTHEIMTIISKEPLTDKQVMKIASEDVIKVFQEDQYEECVEFAKIHYLERKKNKKIKLFRKKKSI